MMDTKFISPDEELVVFATLIVESTIELVDSEEVVLPPPLPDSVKL